MPWTMLAMATTWISAARWAAGKRRAVAHRAEGCPKHCPGAKPGGLFPRSSATILEHLQSLGWFPRPPVHRASNPIGERQLVVGYRLSGRRWCKLGLVSKRNSQVSRNCSIPPGKRPVVPDFRTFPRYQPSPKSSSSSTNSILSPRRNVSSSGPRASKSSRSVRKIPGPCEAAGGIQIREAREATYEQRRENRRQEGRADGPEETFCTLKEHGNNSNNQVESTVQGRSRNSRPRCGGTCVGHGGQCSSHEE